MNKQFYFWAGDCVCHIVTQGTLVSWKVWNYILKNQSAGVRGQERGEGGHMHRSYYGNKMCAGSELIIIK